MAELPSDPADFSYGGVMPIITPPSYREMVWLLRQYEPWGWLRWVMQGILTTLGLLVLAFGATAVSILLAGHLTVVRVAGAAALILVVPTLAIDRLRHGSLR